MVDIARLTVRMEAENAKLTRQLEKSQRDVHKFERNASKSLKKFGTAAKLAFSAIGTGIFVAATRNALDYADSVDKAAQVSGLAATTLQELRFAGDQLGLTTKEVDEGFRRFGRRLGKLANDESGPAAKAMEQLGIAVEDTEGKFRGTEAVFNDVVKAMEGVESQAQISAYAAELFGDDAGPKLALLLKQGTAGVNELRQEALDLGIVLDDALIATAVEAKDQLAKLGRVISVQVAESLLNLSPVIIKTANAFLELSRIANRAFFDIKTSTNANAIEAEISDLLGKIQSSKARLDQALKAEAGNSAQDFLVALGLPSPEVLQRRIDEYEGELKTAYARLSEVQFDAGQLISPAIVGDDALPEKLSSVKAKFEEMTGPMSAYNKLLAEAAQLTKAMITPQDQLFDSMERYDELLEKNLISQATWVEANKKALADFNSAVDEGLNPAEEKTKAFADALAANMSSAFEDAVIAGENFSDVMNGLLDDILATILRMAVIRPLTEGIALGLTGIFNSGGTTPTPTLYEAAAGGPAKKHQPFIVGEMGKELFIPDEAGVIIPNNKLPSVSSSTPSSFGGGDVTVNVQNNIGEADVDVSQQTRPDGKQLINIILNKVSESISTNGTVGQAMQQSFGSRHTAMSR